MPALTARRHRRDGDYHLFADGVEFGRLSNCEVAHVFVSEDEELAERINEDFEGGMTIRQMLEVVRQHYTA